ncbi:MAG: type II secretion system F family protein [Magnetococcales bacterium]|nr:type II secretion system F family protein [Magnetococcales bacterium]
MATVKLATLLIFTNQFASMLRSQLPLISVLENLSRETPQKALREAIEDVTDDVMMGRDFGDALADHPKIFDHIYVNVVRAGMMSGKLSEALTQVSEYLNKMDNIGRQVRGALSYPLFMLVAFFAVFNAMVFFILPRFATMFNSFGKELPWATRVLMSIGNFWRDNWFLLVGGVAAVGISFMVWVATPDGRYIWDENKLKFPVLGPLWRMAALARILRTLGVQLHNEVELLKSLELAAQGCGNAYLEDILLHIADEVETGQSISECFREHEIFEGIVLQMISAGEESGELDELLLSAADFFERMLDNRIQMATGLINPILTVFMGLAIAGMMVASFLPVFEMGGAVKG